MGSYLNNVLMSAGMFLALGCAIWLGTFFVPKPKSAAGDPERLAQHRQRLRLARRSTLAIMVAGTAYAALLPSNTPKNALDVNIKRENQARADAILNKDPGVIKNIAAQPTRSDDERAERFDELVDRKKITGGQP